MSDHVATAPMGAEVGEVAAGGSLAGDAWKALRGNPVFWISAALITLFLVMAIFPGLFTDKDTHKESLPGIGNIDGSIFVRAAGVVMSTLGWVSHGEPAGKWDTSGLGWDDAWKDSD